MAGKVDVGALRGRVALVRRQERSAAFYASAVLVLTLLLGILVGLCIPHGGEFHKGDLFRRLISWDGTWYLKIGQDGYSWNPATAATAYQNIAFFPVQGLIDRLAIFLCGAHAFPAIVALSLALGIASIYAFEALARSVAPDRALAATWLFALWPAGAFHLMGYPTGLTSICVIEALHASWRGRKWSAAAWLGLGTATAPMVVFVAAGIGIMQGIRELRRAGAAGIVIWALWCGVALSGLVLFMVYQAIVFHDAVAFIQAQAAWGKSEPIPVKLVRLLSPTRHFMCTLVGLRTMTTGLIHLNQAGGLTWAQHGFQILLSEFCFWTALVGLIRFTRGGWRRCPDAVLAGWAVYLGYAWFVVASNEQVADAARLLLPALALFWGLSPTCALRGTLRRTAVYLGAVSVMEVAFAVSGYWII